MYDWIAKYREGGLAVISMKIAPDRPTSLDDGENAPPECDDLRQGPAAHYSMARAVPMTATI